MSYKLAPIILNSTQNVSKSTSDIFIAQPDANKEALAGKLFVLAEIALNKSLALKLINFLINNINHNYYQNEKIILRERITSLKVEHIFESSLAKTNKDLADFLEREKFKINLSDINITIGVVHESNLYFSSAGKNKSLLIYKHKPQKNLNSKSRKSGPAEVEETRYKITDIGGDETNPVSKNTKHCSDKFFSNVISGQMPIGGYFFFSNETLPEYLSNAQLLEIITKLPPASAAEQIKNTLSKINAYVTFLGLIIKNTAGIFNAPIAESVISQSVSAQNSVSVLNSTEEKTEKILTPYGMINFGKWLKLPFTAAANLFKSNENGKKGKIFLMKENIFFRKKPAYLSFKKFTGLIIEILFYIFGIVSFLFKAIADKEKREELFTKIKKITGNFIGFFIGILPWFKSLEIRNKIIIVILVLCIGGFGANLFMTHLINQKQADAQILTALKTSIEEKQNQVDAHLLYNNEDGASAIMSELKELITKLPRKSNEDIEYYNKIAEKNEKHIEKIGHIVKVEAPEEIADLSKLNSQAEALNMIFAGNKIYSGDSKSQTIYAIDLNDKSATAITDLKQSIAELNLPIVGDDGIIYFLNGKSLISLNPESQELASIPAEFPENSQIAGAAIFNNRFYYLDKKNNKIYRLTKSDSGLSNIYSWLQTPADLSGAISLSIDGQAYVLSSNGAISKYLKGANVDFSLSKIQPELVSPAKLSASSDLEYLYILEPANKRLIVFNKEGDLVIQYQSDKFDNLKDFSIDEKNKRIYLLNGQMIYSTPATFLEK